jgi:hypothetical protein
MKKSLLFSLAALATLGSAFAATPNFLWAKLLDSPQTSDIPTEVAIAGDGNPVVLSQFGSRTASDIISFDGVTIATGAATNSNSDNLNLLVTKHNAKDGSLVWAVSSKEGDFYVASYANLVATADGGVLVLVNGRVADYTPYSTPVLKDATGKEVELSEFNTSARVYNQVLIKINESGAIEWARSIAQDQLPVPNATATGATERTSQGVSPYALAEDAEGNIYIGGNYRSPIIFTGKNYSSYVLTARNIENYTGDTQAAAGGLYIVRLDSNGNYVNHVRAKGELTRDQACSFVLDGSTLYFAGNISGAEGDQLTVGDKTVTIKSTAAGGLVVGSVSTDLNTVNFLTYLKPYLKSNKSTTQLKGINLLNNQLYLYGLFTGGLGTADSSAASLESNGTALEGWYIALNSSTGSWENAGQNKTTIGGYIDAFSYDGKIYFAGYQMNKTTGAFLEEYTPGYATYTNRYTIAKAGGVPTGYGAAFDPKTLNFYGIARGNAAFELADGSTTSAPTSWGSVIAAYTFAEESGVNAANADTNALSVKGGEGQIVITANGETDIQVVNTLGQTIAATTVKAGTTNIPVSTGIYLVNNIKVAVK